MLLQARANSPLVERGKDVVQGSELAASLARKDYAPDYTLSGGYFKPGRPAAAVEGAGGFQTAGVFLAQAACRGDRAGGERQQARHEYAATLVEVEAEISRAIQHGGGVAKAGESVREDG